MQDPEVEMQVLKQLCRSLEVLFFGRNLCQKEKTRFKRRRRQAAQFWGVALISQNLLSVSSL